MMHLLAIHKVKGNLTVILILSKGFQNKVEQILKKHDGREVFNLQKLRGADTDEIELEPIVVETVKKNSFAESLDGVLDPDVLNSNPNVFKDLQSHYGEMMNNPMEIFDDYQIKSTNHKVHLGNKFPGP